MACGGRLPSFLCLMNLSAATLVLKAMYMFAQGLNQSSAQNLVIPPFLLLFSCVVFGIVIALRWSAYRLLRKLILFVVLGLLMIAYYLAVECPPCSPFGDTRICRHGCDRGRYPRVVADDCRVHRHILLTKKHGVRAFWPALLISFVLAGMFVVNEQVWWEPSIEESLFKAWPWAINSTWGAPLSFSVIGLYLIVNAAFLQPYLGDAARYFRVRRPMLRSVARSAREAVDTLDYLHTSGRYDRIIVVAHSLGRVVSYDMLRTISVGSAATCRRSPTSVT